MKNFAAACAILIAVASGLAGTRKVPPEEPFATIRIPDDWQIKEHPEIIEATPPDKTVFFLIAAGERNKVGEAIGETMRYMRNRDRIIVKSESRHDEDGKINAIPVHFVSWQGKNMSGDVDLKFTILILANGQSLVAAWDGSPSALKKHHSELDEILRSITKIESASGDEDRDRAKDSKTEKE